jgi:hypothetical protein
MINYIPTLTACVPRQQSLRSISPIMTAIIELPNTALLMDGIDELNIREHRLALPVSSDGKLIVPAGCVLVEIKVTGICGSDVGPSGLILGDESQITIVNRSIYGNTVALSAPWPQNHTPWVTNALGRLSKRERMFLSGTLMTESQLSLGHLVSRE